MSKLLAELRRRNVFRVAGVYAVVGWLLAQAAGVLENALAMPGWFDTVVVSLLLLGLPIALVFAWAFELTPEGVKLTADVPESESIAPKTGRKLDYAILAGLAIVVIVVVADRVIPGKPGSPQATKANGLAGAEAAPVDGEGPTVKAATGARGASVAVLPFDNRSAREEDAYFAEGIHDDLLTQLSKISSLRVISRTSVLGYAGTTKKIPDIAKELGVAVVLEGAVQRAGERVRINVQLIDGTSDAHLWAENYDRALTAENVFDIQAEIAGAIAAALKTALKVEERAAISAGSTRNIDAYEAYIRGNTLLRYETGTHQDYLAAIAEFDRATRLDPSFAAAFAAKAKAQLSVFWYAAEGVEWRDAARVSIDRATALAPDAPETLTALGYYHYWGFFDYARADAILDRAIERAPNSVWAWLAKGFVARRDGRLADAVAALDTARRLDPLNYEPHVEIGDTLAAQGRFAEAREALDRAREISPTSTQGPFYEAWYWTQRGDPDRAWAAVRTSRLYFDYRFLNAVNTRDLKTVDFALETWPEAERRPASFPEAYETARAEALLMAGRKTEAASVLDAIKQRRRKQGPENRDVHNAQSAFFDVDAAGLAGDLAAVRAADRDYRDNALKDLWYDRDRRLSFAKAYARAGDPGAALDHLESLAASFGPATFLQFSINPAFDPIRGHGRYLALKAAYENWISEHPDTK